MSNYLSQPHSPSGTCRKLLTLGILLAGCPFLSVAQVGIGTTTPKAFFNVPANRTVLFGDEPAGAGSKLIWLGSKSAFRAGFLNEGSYSTAWDEASVGQYSFASGRNTTARGFSSTAMGDQTTASGNYATALGFLTTASANYTTAMGYQTNASGQVSIAMGFLTTASGDYATAMGLQTTASGNLSSALGNYVSTNARNGAFIIGDNSNTTYTNSATNQMMMRFGGGYVLYTTTSGPQNTALGAELKAGANAWSTLSDSTKKENFRQADGPHFLDRIATLRLGSWNYKGQDPHQHRHYGPMAQEVFAAFGHDGLGVIGEATSINQADFDGINLIAIQALIKENQQLKAKLATLEDKDKTTQARLDKLEAALRQQPHTPDALPLRATTK